VLIDVPMVAVQFCHQILFVIRCGVRLIMLCAMLRIPVCMHNIADKDIFRPACWNAFGMDKEGADYRACANFGPIYK